MNYHAAKAFILDKLDSELSNELTYHGVHHTLDVLYTADEICQMEKVSAYETLLVKTAALFHDSGFIISNNNHERWGCYIAASFLPRYDYSETEIERIKGMIMATRIPQGPKNRLEAILCDADLDYLGRDDFYEIGDTLFQELKTRRILDSEQSWNRLQVNFLQSHAFFTPTNLRRRATRKENYLSELKEVVAQY